MDTAATARGLSGATIDASGNVVVVIIVIIILNFSRSFAAGNTKRSAAAAAGRTQKAKSVSSHHSRNVAQLQGGSTTAHLAGTTENEASHDATGRPKDAHRWALTAKTSSRNHVQDAATISATDKIARYAVYNATSDAQLTHAQTASAATAVSHSFAAQSCGTRNGNKNPSNDSPESAAVEDCYAATTAAAADAAKSSHSATASANGRIHTSVISRTRSHGQITECTKGCRFGPDSTADKVFDQTKNGAGPIRIRENRRRKEEKEEINVKYGSLIVLVVIIVSLPAAVYPQSFRHKNFPQQYLQIFDPVGEMAGSVTYLHVAIPLNLSSLSLQTKTLAFLLTNMTETYANTHKGIHPKFSSLTRILNDLSIVLLNKLERHFVKLNTIEKLLPQDSHVRTKRFAFLAPFIYFKKAYDDAMWQLDISKNNSKIIGNRYLEAVKEIAGLRKIIADLMDKPDMPDVDSFLSVNFPNLKKVIEGEGSEKFPEILKFDKLTDDDFADAMPNSTIFPRPRITKRSQLDLISHAVELTAHEHSFNNFNQTQAFHTISQHIRNAPKRNKRFLPIALGFLGVITGSLGTFFGLYNQNEIEKLGASISQLEANQNLLMQLSNIHTKQIKTLISDMQKLTNVVDALLEHNPTVFMAQLDEQIEIIAERLEVAIDVIQQLQNRRLSVGLLNGDQMTGMHQSLRLLADSRGLLLFPDKLSDYFQLETSFLRQGENVLVIVHVPCVHPRDQLKLFRFVGYPIQVPSLPHHEHSLQHALYNGSFQGITESTNHSNEFDGLFVKPESELIGVNSLQQFKLVTETELAMCNHRSRFILCEQHQVLRLHLEQSCLGSLFLKSLIGAKQNCKFVRGPLRETVYQVSPTQYLIFSPRAWTPQALCLNGSHFPIFLEAGNNRISLSPGCSAQLADNIITSDFDVSISPEPVQTLWDWDPLTFSFSAYHDMERTDQQIRTLHNDLHHLKTNLTTVDNIEQKISDHLAEPRNYPLPWFLILGSIILFLLIVFCCYLAYCTNACSFCHRLSQIYSSTAPLPNHPAVAYHAAAPPPQYEGQPSTTVYPCVHLSDAGKCSQCKHRFFPNP
jgi:hypothetical protein